MICQIHGLVFSKSTHSEYENIYRTICKMKARINRKAWSEESKRSYAYLSNDAYYEDEKYKCYKCGKTAVFSAQEQKKTYEEDKRYIWQKRTLCPSCYSTYNNINSKIYSFEKQTGSKYKSSSIDGSVIKEWLSMLKELPYLW